MSLAGTDAADASDGIAPMTAPPPMTAPAPRPAFFRNAARVLGSTLLGRLLDGAVAVHVFERPEIGHVALLLSPAALTGRVTVLRPRDQEAFARLRYRFKDVLRASSCRSA